MKRINRILLGIAMGSCPIVSPSQEVPEHFYPARPNGMGGAYTAIANDENAVWTNPAGIGRINKARSRRSVGLIKVPNALIGGNSSSQAFYSGLNGSANAKKLANAVSQNKDSLQENPLWAMTAAFPMIMSSFGGYPSVVGVFSTAHVKSVVDLDSDQKDPLSFTEAIADVGFLAATVFTTSSNRLSFGAQLRALNRYAYQDYLPISTLINQKALQKTLANEGSISSALALDLGALWTVADFWYPTIGIAILNFPQGCIKDYLNPFSKIREKVCGTKFAAKSSFKNPDALSNLDPTDIRFGISIMPRIKTSSPKLSARIAFDIHHLSYQIGQSNYGLPGIDIRKQLHAGIEIFTGNPLTPSPFSVSMGSNQGYYSLGVTARFWSVTVELVSFGRDVSSSAKPKEDRRSIAAISIDM